MDWFYIFLMLVSSSVLFFLLARYFSGLVDHLTLYHSGEPFRERVLQVFKIYLITGLIILIIMYIALNLEMIKGLVPMENYERLLIASGISFGLIFTVRILSLFGLCRSKKIKYAKGDELKQAWLEHRERITSFIFSFIMSFMILFIILLTSLIFLDSNTIIKPGNLLVDNIGILIILIILIPLILAVVSETIFLIWKVPNELQTDKLILEL